MTMLKFQNKNVLEFDLDNMYLKIWNKNFLPVVLRDALFEMPNSYDDSNTKKTVDEILKMDRQNIANMNYFFKNRVMSFSRTHAKQILNALLVDQFPDDQNIMRLMFLCKGLSIADDYWLTNNPDEKWEDVNLRENPLHTTLANVALWGITPPSITGEIRTPELTNQGSFAKAWKRNKDNGKLYLLKTSSNNKESEREVSVSNILNYTNVPHVRYYGKRIKNKYVSICENIVNSNRSIVTAHNLMSWCIRTQKDWVAETKKIDAKTFGKMLIVDFIVSNSDRHNGNWGFFMDANTGHLTQCHPLLDHNLAFNKETMHDKEGLQSLTFKWMTKYEAAKSALSYADFQINPEIPRDVFLQPSHAESFLKKCDMLGFKVKMISASSSVFNSFNRK